MKKRIEGLHDDDDLQNFFRLEKMIWLCSVYYSQ